MLSPDVLRALEHVAALIRHEDIPAHLQLVLHQGLMGLLPALSADAAAKAAQLAEADDRCRAWQARSEGLQQNWEYADAQLAQAHEHNRGWQARCAGLEQHVSYANRVALDNHAAAVAAQQQAAAAHWTAVDAINKCNAAQELSRELLQVACPLAAAVLGRSVPLQTLALLSIPKWRELVQLFMLLSCEEINAFSSSLKVSTSSAEAMAAVKDATVCVLQQRMPMLPPQLLHAAYEYCPSSACTLLQTQQKASMLPSVARGAWERTAAQCKSLQDVCSLIELAASLTAAPFNFSSMKAALLLEAPQPAAAACAASYRSSYQQAAQPAENGSATAAASHSAAQYSSCSMRHISSKFVDQLLSLPAHRGCQAAITAEPAHLAGVDAVVHVLVTRGNKSMETNNSQEVGSHSCVMASEESGSCHHKGVYGSHESSDGRVVDTMVADRSSTKAQAAPESWTAPWHQAPHSRGYHWLPADEDELLDISLPARDPTLPPETSRNDSSTPVGGSSSTTGSNRSVASGSATSSIMSNAAPSSTLNSNGMLRSRRKGVLLGCRWVCKKVHQASRLAVSSAVKCAAAAVTACAVDAAACALVYAGFPGPC